MKLNPQTKNRRRAMTLVEAMLATTILATVVTSVSVIVRTAHTTWLAQESDRTTYSGANAVARQVVRHVRQGERVIAISGPGDNSGTLTIESSDGDHLVWDHNASTDTVSYGVNAATELLAENISQLNFVGYQADGVTTTTEPNEIQAIKVSVAVLLPSGTKRVTAWAWMRAW